MAFLKVRYKLIFPLTHCLSKCSFKKIKVIVLETVTAPKISIFSIVIDANHSFYVKTIETHARTFLSLNISAIGKCVLYSLGFYWPLKSRGPILRVTSSETRSSFALAKFEYSLLIGQCWSLCWSRDTFLIKLWLYLRCLSYLFLSFFHFFFLRLVEKLSFISNWGRQLLIA